MNRQLQDGLSLPPDVRKGLQQYELGRDLLSVPEAGWDAILSLLKKEIESDEQKVNGYKESDPNELFGLHKELQGKRKQLARLELSRKQLTALVEAPPENIQKYLLNY